MNENIDLVEILKDAPKGTKLWSPIFGECTLLEVNENENKNSVSLVEYPISCEDNIGKHFSVTKEGKFFNKINNAECILFPSKENRDWSTFKVPKKHKEFKPFQKVLWVDHIQTKAWTAGFYSHYNELIKRHVLISGYIKRDYDILPYEGNEDKLGQIVK